MLLSDMSEDHQQIAHWIRDTGSVCITVVGLIRELGHTAPTHFASIKTNDAIDPAKLDAVLNDLAASYVIERGVVERGRFKGEPMVKMIDDLIPGG